MNLKLAIQLLGITEFTGIEDLKKCFHEQAHRTHPDKNKNSQSDQEFRDLVQAYRYALENLGELYAHFGMTETEQDEFTAKTTIENLDDIFEDIFGFSKSGRVLGSQQSQVIYVKLEEFLSGAKLRKKMNAMLLVLIVAAVARDLVSWPRCVHIVLARE